MPPPVDPARALAASEEQFRIAFDHAPTGMAILSLLPESAGHYLRANAALCSMLGREPAELLGQSFLAVTHPDDCERDRDILQRLMRGETKTALFEKRYVRADGETIFASVAWRVAPDPEGDPCYAIVHVVDETPRRREQAQLERMALTDSLTGLANRTLLNDRLGQALARLHREDSYAALLLLDIDRFKTVNESFGHEAGDELLIGVASRIEAISRADATVARVGADEFVVLVEGLSGPAEVHRIGVRLLEALRKPHVVSSVTEPLPTTVSIGIAIAGSADRAASEVYREADLALRRAKDGGRDQYALYDAELSARVVSRMDSENLLRRAIADDLLVPHYQPVIDLEHGHINGVEALVRINDPVRGLVPPAEFIDLAEETGLITEVDVRMFELAIGQLASWTSAGQRRLVRMAVNVSARSLDDPQFVKRIGSVLTWYDIPGDHIRIELTERSLLATSETVQRSLTDIEELGIHLGVDDFGTGYSAMAYLQRFRLRFLKIDRSFVSRLGQNKRDDAVVSSVIDIAQAHDLVVVAEGIETPEQLSALRAMGCDSGQGFLMSRPVDRQTLEALVAEDPSW